MQELRQGLSEYDVETILTMPLILINVLQFNLDKENLNINLTLWHKEAQQWT